jgi:hypothetical protein
MYLAFTVEGSRRRAHEDVAVLVGLDAVGEPGELGIGKDLSPASHVEAGLRGEVRKLDSDRHRHQHRCPFPWGQIRSNAVVFFFLAFLYAGVSQRRRFFCSCRLCQYAGAAGELWISEIERLETLASTVPTINLPLYERPIDYG